MSKILKRCFAYLIDMMVVLIITQSLSGISFLNPNLEKYNKYYNEYNETFTKYYNFKSNLTIEYKDEKLSEKEYNKIIKDNESYQQILEKYYEDKSLTKKEYNAINNKIDKQYIKEYKRLYYQIEKNSISYFIIYLITVLAYFVGFNKITDGQTLGKKILRLKIVSSDKNVDKVPIWSYIIRTIILYQPIYYLVKLIGVYTLNSNNYYNLTSIFYDIQYYLEFIIIISILLRLDGRGIHDLISKTRVALYNKEGKEIEEQSISFLSKRLDGIKLKKSKKKKQEKTSE